MPIFNITISDTSPLIRYSGLWHDSDHADALWANYSNGTFHATDQYNASAALTFNGSAVYVYGAKRTNHGQYWVTLDGVRTIANGIANDIWNTTIFTATDLGSGEHNLLLQNAYLGSTPQWVDIDYVIITAGDGNELNPSKDTFWDDDSKNITYTNGWDTSPNGVEDKYYMHTMHRTNVLHASATINFSGDAISVIGHASTNHGLFSVTLDDGDPLILNGSASAPRPQSLLYYASGLSTSPHTLTVTNVDTNGAWLDIDEVVVTQWSSVYTNIPNTTPSSPAASPTESILTHHSKPNTGLIVGVTIAGVIGLTLLILGIIFLVRRSMCNRSFKNPSTAFKEEIDSEPNQIHGTIVEPFEQWTTVTHSQVHLVPHTQTLGAASAASSSNPLSPSASGSDSKLILTMTVSHTDELNPPPGYHQAISSLSRDEHFGSIS